MEIMDNKMEITIWSYIGFRDDLRFQAVGFRAVQASMCRWR